ncbi:ABC transporter ATP-binding protein [Novosphingobium soli]|uniref:ABC transporter ATP-binding protein n=1 Tax=Novosphingobium soli TaxID=574956 RepID=A0ABV6CYP4_9SPHN
MSDLILDHIRVRRGERTILHDISLRFTAGGLTAVIGPNGAGKSTMLDLAAGLLVPDAGTVRLGDIALATIGRKLLAQRRAYLPQRAGVEWPISVERVVALGLTPSLPAFGVLPDRLVPAVEEALAACDLLALRDRPATALSGGELARTMLARAIVGDPELLIVDEPTAGLDPRHAIDAMRRLRARADAGRTVIVAIHDLDLALNHADNIVAIRDGRLLTQGPVAEVVTEDLLATLYDVRIRILRDADGVAVRFLDDRRSG